MDMKNPEIDRDKDTNILDWRPLVQERWSLAKKTGAPKGPCT